MGKKRLRKSRTSNGLINLHNRKVINAIRRDKKANPTMEMLMAKIANEQSKMSPMDRARLEEKRFIKRNAQRLFDKYKSKGVKWSACVQAVKTNWVPQFETKWHNR